MMKLINLKNKSIASDYVAVELLKLIQSTPTATLGLATGNTMTEIYPRLSELLTANRVNLNDIKTFNLDEYVGLNSSHPQSYYTYMHELLLIITNGMKIISTFQEETHLILKTKHMLMNSVYPL